jgi:DNA-binding winged helix-turn-helix (wHTH) protein/tetratricopeptide (TPR) repeat protein
LALGHEKSGEIATENLERPLRWRSGPLELDSETAQLTRSGCVVPIAPLALSLLEYLVFYRHRVVTRDELAAQVWQGVTVADGALRRAIWHLRQTLGDSADGEAFVATVRGRGYRFVAPIEVERARPAAPSLGAQPPNSEARVAASRRGDVHPMLGREGELRQIERSLRACVDAGGRACALIGPAGSGKSRLAREFLSSASRDGQHVAAGQADADRMTPPFWPWLQMLTSYSRSKPELRQRYASVAPAVFSLLEGAARSGPAQPPDAELNANQRARLLAEMEALFVALTSDYPGVLLFEDLQWADEASLAFLSHLLPLLTQTRSLLLVTCRTFQARTHRALARAMHGLARSTWSEQITLGNLDASAVAQLLEAHSAAPPAAALSQQVYEISRGNPLFVTELSRLLATSADATRSHPRAEAIQIEWVIRRRLAMLPEDAQSAVDAAAVLGLSFSLGDLAGTLGEDPSLAVARLDLCLEHEVFAGGEDDGFRFAHPLLRESAYAALSIAARTKLHLAAAVWLESSGAERDPVRLNDLARHFLGAAPLGQARKAVHYCLCCAELACTATAHEDAKLHYERALEAAKLDAAIEAAEIVDIELRRGEALRGSGAATEAVNQHFLILSQRARALKEPEMFARAVLGYTGQRPTRYTPTRSPISTQDDRVVLLTEALDALGGEPGELRVLLLCSLAGALLYSTQRARREQTVEEALAIAEQLGEPRLIARVLGIGSYCCAAPDARSERVAVCDRLVSLARGSQLAAQECDALVTRAMLQLGIGDVHGADTDIARARYLARKLAQPQLLARADLVDLMRAFWRGDVREARDRSQRALASNPCDEVERGFFTMRMLSIDVLEHGLRPQTVDVYEALLAEYPDAVGLRAVLASNYATLFQPERALHHYDLAAAGDFGSLPADVNWLNAICLLADAAVRLRDRARARVVYDRLLPHARVFDFYSAEGVPGGPVAFWLAQLAMTLGDPAAAQQWLERSHYLCARLGATLFDMQNRLGWARLWLEFQPREAPRAREMLSEVRAFASRQSIGLLDIAARQVESDFALAAGSRPDCVCPPAE